MRIEEVRKSKKMTRSELARAVGVEITSIYRYERNGRIPDVIIAAKIAKKLKCKVEDLLTKEDLMPAN